MKIACAGTGSSGNTYVISDSEGSAVVLDCGVSFAKALRIMPSRPQFALVTHKHKDHSGYINDYTKRGVYVFAPSQVVNEIDDDTGFLNGITQGLEKDGSTKYSMTKMGSWFFIPFAVDHEKRVDCVGYALGSSVDHDMLIYITDAWHIPYDFTGKAFDHLILEVNYDDQTLHDNILKTGDTALKYQAGRHMSLRNAVKWLKKQNLSGVDTIHVCHMSDRNCNEALVKKTLEQEFGKHVIIF